MASFYQKNREDRKATGLSDGQAVQSGMKPGTGAEGGGNPRVSGKVVAGRRRRGWISVLVDIILLLALAGIVVGAFFGYRALREVYAPTWEMREVVFCVEMEGIDPDMLKYGKDGRPAIVGKAIWSSETTEADCLGTVTDVRTVLVSEADGRNTLTLYLTVSAEAYYRAGKGYRMGSTMLLAGTEGVYRVNGLCTEGMIISMHELAEDTTEAETILDAPDEAA